MYMIQLEKGENGTPHYQGCMYFKHAVQLNTLKQLSKNFIGRFVTLGKKALLYCSKSDTRIDGPWCFGIPDAPIRIPPLRIGNKIYLLLLTRNLILGLFTGVGKTW